VTQERFPSGAVGQVLTRRRQHDVDAVVEAEASSGFVSELRWI